MRTIRLFTLLTAVFTLASCDKDEEQTVNFEGKLELVDEFGEELTDFTGVAVTFFTNEGEKTVLSDVNGTYLVELGISEEIEKITFEKEGFASQQLVEDFDRAKLQRIQLIQISSLEVSDFEAEERDCGSTTCFTLTFRADNFYTDQIEKRFFDLHAYRQNQFVGSLRFFSFQETFSEANKITRLSDTAAEIEVEVSGLWFLNDFSTNTEIELRVYGATANETYKFYDLDTEIDNSLNPNYGVAIVKMK
ncbi:MAG: hypothetical protein Tsb0034_29860 [Ekhidna sp.]